MAKSWLIDCKGIAKKVRNATLSSAVQIKDSGTKLECPKCHYWIDNSDVSYEWPGLPAGVKFDPSDVELLEHLASKCGIGDAESHAFIDEFISTIETDKGICYTHPKDLPGASKDGNSVHFFYKTTNAYASGQRKRRKIETQQNEEAVRWHKTGKTKPVYDNGIQKGFKKIMVLYRSSQSGSKPVKSNWVMHQYHLGSEEDEKEGQYVVSKIYYQQQKYGEKIADSVEMKEYNPSDIPYGPKTPKTIIPNPPRAEISILLDDASDDNIVSSTEDQEDKAICFPPSCSQYGGDNKPSEYLADESQAPDADVNDQDDSLLCKEIFSSCAPLDDGIVNSITDLRYGGENGTLGVNGFENIDLGPDCSLADLPFGSQDILDVWNWL